LKNAVVSEVDERLKQEARRFELRFTCEACAHYAPERGACGNGYPTLEHRAVELSSARAIVFCKEFELS
jgi:hypothetical protein